MGSEKEEFKLAERCSVKSSKRIFAEEYVDRGIPFWRSKDVIDKALGEFQRFDLFISEKRYLEISSKYGSPVQGDLLLSSVGNRSGQPYVIKDEGDFYFKDGNIIWLSDFSNLDSEFLSYWLKSHIGQSALSAVMIGSAQKALTIDAIRNLDVSFPFLNYQKKAVKILGSLDNKITLNRQLNQTLEQMAQALFKSWFVDFDPVIDNALAAGNEIPTDLQDRAERRQLQFAKADHKPLPENIRKLFPSEFELTESLGWVPKGWGVNFVGNVIDVVGGGTPSTKEQSYWDGEFAFCTPKDMSSLSSKVLLDTERHLTVAGVAKVSSGQLPVGTVLMSSRAPIGYLAINQTPVSINQGIIALKPNNNFSAEYLICWLESNMEEVISRANGSTFLEISKNNFRDIPFLIPANSCLNSFGEMAGNFFKRLVETQKQIEQLTKLRDTLLPKLISGELRIPEAQSALSLALSQRERGLESANE